MLAEWAEAKTFSATRLRPGYDEDEVDAFRTAIRDTFLGIREPPLTPEDVKDKQFSTTRLRPGYDEEEVDAFLDEAELRLAGARCGAPAGYQPPAADPAAAQRAGRSGPSPGLMITVGVATLALAAGLLAGRDHPGTSTSATPPADGLTVYQLQTGECLQTGDETLVNFNEGNGPFTAVPCTQPHTAEVFFAGNSWPRSLAYPGDQAIYNDGYVRCDSAFSAYDGIASWLSAFTLVPSTPDSSTWAGGDRWLACLATNYGSVDYSIRGSRQ
jgi:DivIVA domain-containing protein